MFSSLVIRAVGLTAKDEVTHPGSIFLHQDFIVVRKLDVLGIELAVFGQGPIGDHVVN